MQVERLFDVAELRWRDDSRVPNPDRMQRSVEILGPEIQELVQLGKLWRVVELLLDETLENAGLIGDVIDDLGGGHPPPFQL